MATEFKRLFFVKDFTKIQVSKEYLIIEQFYLSFFPNSIRCRDNNGMRTITTKIRLDNGTKFEYSKNLTEKEYDDLKSKAVSKILTKERHEVWIDNNPCLFDIYTLGIDCKLLLIEFENKEEMDAFIPPLYLEETDAEIYTINQLKR